MRTSTRSTCALLITLAGGCASTSQAGTTPAQAGEQTSSGDAEAVDDTSSVVVATAQDDRRRVLSAPVGLAGEAWDLRDQLPPGAEPVELGDEGWAGEYLELGARGNDTALRLRVWTTGDGTYDDEGDPRMYVAGIAVEVMENPNGSNISWIVDEEDPERPHLEVVVEWRSARTTHGLRLSGVIGIPEGISFVQDPR